MDTALVERLRKDLPVILQDRPVVLAYLYGSAATGHVHPFSDVDIALVVSPDRALGAYERFRLEAEIAVEIESRCGVREADVRIINEAPLSVQGRVVTEGCLLYAKDDDLRVAYEVHTRKRYFDFQPVLAMMRKAYFARLEADLRKKGVLHD